jgi:hypothetical protein
MGLTWKDLVSSVAVLAILFAYMAFQLGAGVPVVSTAWATSAVVLALAACCAVAAAGDLHTRPQPRWGVVVRRITTVTGAIALVAGLIGLLASSGHALEVLVAATIVLWATATFWHVLSIGAEQ